MKEMKFYSFILIFLIAGCEEPERTYRVSGIVRNWGSKQPMEGATVAIQDFLAAGSIRDELRATPGRYFEVLTDANGYFELSIKSRENVFVWAGMDGPKHYSFDPNHTDGISIGVRGVSPGNNAGLILELQSYTTFNPLFQKKVNRLPTDSVYIGMGSWFRPFGIIDYNTEPYVGEGPFYYARREDSDWPLTVGDVYILYKIKQKINGVWMEKLDSVYVPGQINYNETIYY